MGKQMVFVAVALAAIGVQTKLAPPKIEDYTHVCHTCGGTTHYPFSTRAPRTSVETLRKGCATLREYGVDAVLDESVLCRHCVRAEKLKIPRFATVRCCPEKTHWREGDRVEVVSTSLSVSRLDKWSVVPVGNRFWVNGQYIDANGTILGNRVCIRLHPDMDEGASGHANKGDKMRILPRSEADPVGWVGVEWYDPMNFPAYAYCFEKVEYGEGEDASVDRIFNHLEWTIKGKRSHADLRDLTVLLAYLRGEKEVQEGCLMMPIARRMPRVRVLLGGLAVAKKGAVQYTTAGVIATIAEAKPWLDEWAKSAHAGFRINVFKRERLVELSSPSWKNPIIYPMTAFSGKSGPKLREGDGQIPEGIYRVAYMNPNSRYHLSFKVSYPNAFDQAMAKKDGRTRLGGDIMIHGSNVTVGCVPIGDEAIEEVFFLVAKVGFEKVEVVIAPYDMRKGRRRDLEESSLAWYPRLCDDICAALTPPENGRN